MIALGIRVEPRQSTFVIIHKTQEGHIIHNCELLKVPQALDFPEQLKYVRNCVLDILREYEVQVAGIRIAESNTQNLDITRLYIEGVIQEAFSSSDLDKYFTGRKTSIASRIQIKPQDLADIIDGKKPMDIANWKDLTNKIAREAALVALGALK